MLLRNLITQFIQNTALSEQIRSTDSERKTKNNFNQICNFLNKNVPTGAPVGIFLDYENLYLTTILSCIYQGVPFIPLNKSWPQTRVDEILKHANAHCIIDEPLLLRIQLAASDGLIEPKSKVNNELPLYIIYTSGTTGHPKGVVIARKNYENFLRWCAKYFAFIPTKTPHLVLADFTFDMSFLDIALILLRETQYHFSSDSRNIFRVANEIEKYRIKLINCVPNLLARLLDDTVYRRADIKSLAYLLLGGSRFTLSLYQLIPQKINPPFRVFNLYGPTEATVYSHCRQLYLDLLHDTHNGVLCIGKPIENMNSFILDENQNEIVAPYRTGQLVLTGAQLMKGYLNCDKDPALIQTEIPMYLTGDSAFCNEDGDFFVQSRMDDTLKHRGFRVNLRDIDAQLIQLDWVGDITSVAIENSLTDNDVVSFLISNEKKSYKTIKSAFTDVLLPQQMPDSVIQIDEMPLNSSGKVCIQSLTRMAKEFLLSKPN